MEEPTTSSPVLKKCDENQDLVQIKAANEEEVQRRINAFIRNKRSEIDERNTREFISPFSADASNSCARVEAVYIRREGQKSHVTLKHVDNAYGPQTQQSATEYGKPLTTRLPLDLERREAIEERLSNMEAHLQLRYGGDNTFQRIKALEERIMFLEGLSLEYFNDGVSIPKSRHVAVTREDQEENRSSQTSYSQGESLSSIDKRIDQLKQMLKLKAEKCFPD